AAKQALDGLDNVTIHRTDTFSAYETLKGQQFDIIYIDANHQYEYVLRDIKLFAELLTENGLIILNDAIASPMGRTQNLGVLEAVSSFLKGTHFAPLAVTATDWADLIIGRSDAIIAHVGALIALANFPKINVPPELLYAFSLVDFRGRPFIDFGSAYKEYNLHKINFEAAKKAS
ncbi:MAG: class I SAM-dependent methyltransferase, partial [Rickettsiales bacterium]|nr:class I SAM-dependent methyltransferase [Rickettsiales bacterium]